MTKRGVYRVLVTRIHTEATTIELKAASRKEAEFYALIKARDDSYFWTETDEPVYKIEAVNERKSRAAQ